LHEGTIKWKIPLGEVPELAVKGFKNTGSHFPKVGPVVTAGGLIFTGTRDKKVRALDVNDGKVLFQYELSAALEGIPAVYEVRGRQYIAFCAAAQVGLTPSTQVKIEGAYVAFALPRARSAVTEIPEKRSSGPPRHTKHRLDGNEGRFRDLPF
jgi:quinoprotein glucose dehydrogenase